jgi:hypothetical protein
MAVTTTTGPSVPASESADARVYLRSFRHRRITPEAGRALEILGHAVEYLTDEFMSQGSTFFLKKENMEAVQILMALNRQVYFECPEVPCFGERFRALLRSHTA